MARVLWKKTRVLWKKTIALYSKLRFTLVNYSTFLLGLIITFF